MTEEEKKAIERLNRFKTIEVLYSNTFAMHIEQLKTVQKDIDTVLKALENSIPKKKIQYYLKEEQERFEIYKKESKTNENLKLGMWKHLGAKNMCEKILGIENNIATLD